MCNPLGLDLSIGRLDFCKRAPGKSNEIDNEFSSLLTAKYVRLWGNLGGEEISKDASPFCTAPSLCITDMLLRKDVIFYIPNQDWNFSGINQQLFLITINPNVAYQIAKQILKITIYKLRTSMCQAESSNFAHMKVTCHETNNGKSSTQNQMSLVQMTSPKIPNFSLGFGEKIHLIQVIKWVSFKMFQQDQIFEQDWPNQ